MPYDRDSFLAGLAVGRTLWRPHRISMGEKVIAIPCFQCGVGAAVDWIHYAYGGPKEYINLDIARGYASVQSWPVPAYWMMAKGSPTDRGFFVVFSPDDTWGGHGVVLSIWGIDAEGRDSPIYTTSEDFWEDSESVLGRYQLTHNVNPAMDISNFYEKYPVYFPTTGHSFSAFLEEARLIQVQDQIYVVGPLYEL